MSRFPRTEPEIAALALVVTQGLREVENSIREQHAEKDDALEDVIDGVKANLRYAEVAVRDKPEKLSRLGWGPRRPSSALQAPGEVRDIRIVAEGDTWAILRWNAPVNGGAPAYYRVQRKQEDAPWEDAGTTTTTEQLMSNRPRGVELQYRVLAVNKAGTGQ